METGPTWNDIGRRVTYRDLPAGKIEEGLISSLSSFSKAVFVRYDGKPTAMLTPIARLEWSTKTPGQTAQRTEWRDGRVSSIDWCEPPRDPALDRVPS